MRAVLQINAMASSSATAPGPSFYSLLLPKTARPQEDSMPLLVSGPNCLRGGGGARARKHHFPSLLRLRVMAVASQPQGGEGPGKRQKAPPGVDTRIHWDNPDDGWIGGGQQDQAQKFSPEEEQKNLLGDKFADLLNDSSDSHYQLSYLVRAIITCLPVFSCFSLVPSFALQIFYMSL